MLLPPKLEAAVTTARMPVPESVRLLRAAVPTPFQGFTPSPRIARARSVRPPPPAPNAEVWSAALLIVVLASLGAGVSWLVSFALFP